MKLFVLKLFSQYDVLNKFHYYLIQAETREEAVKKYNEKNNLNINVRKLNEDDLFEIKFDETNVLDITTNARYLGLY